MELHCTELLVGELNPIAAVNLMCFYSQPNPQIGRMRLLYNAHGRFMLPRKVIRCEKKQSTFYNSIGYDFLFFVGVN